MRGPIQKGDFSDSWLGRPLSGMCNRHVRSTPHSYKSNSLIQSDVRVVRLIQCCAHRRVVLASRYKNWNQLGVFVPLGTGSVGFKRRCKTLAQMKLGAVVRPKVQHLIHKRSCDGGRRPRRYSLRKESPDPPDFP